MIQTYGDPDASLILIQPVDDHDMEEIEEEIEAIKKLTEKKFCLLTYKVKDWNRDLSPWEAPAVFGKEDFGGKAEETLAEIGKLCEDKEKTYVIGGYSLAGLFALWAVSKTNVFKGAAAASPSVWFPGFVEYMKENSLHADHVYLSLGDKEEKARNPVMARVGDCIRETEKILVEKEIDCILEWNEGNHFKDAGKRTAKGFAWVVNKL